MQLERVGLQKTTLIDYPGMVASTVFTHGCNLRCPYCHNPELVTGPVPEDFIPVQDFFDFLDKRSTVLDGVCITGGEPLLYDNLPELIEQIHRFGLKVKLDTNGTLPEKLAKVKPDYIAMDLKAALGSYRLHLGGSSGTSASLKKSLYYLKTCGIDHEVRTTWVPGINTLEDIPEMAELLKGIQSFFITPFRPGITLNPEYSTTVPPAAALLEEVKVRFKKYGIAISIRNINLSQKVQTA